MARIGVLCKFARIKLHYFSVEYLNILARDDEKGLAACEVLKKDGFQPDFYQVDVTNENTVEGLKNYIKSQYGGVDVLINNAGIYCVRILSYCNSCMDRKTLFTHANPVNRGRCPQGACFGR